VSLRLERQATRPEMDSHRDYHHETAVGSEGERRKRSGMLRNNEFGFAAGTILT